MKDEKSFYRYRQNRKKRGSQWEEEKSWALEEDEKSFYCYRQDRKTEGSQWEEEKSWAFEEFGGKDEAK